MKNSDNREARERIVSAAIKLFSRKGFSATSVNEIAEEAKVTKALIYYYFKSKADVLDCLVSSLKENITARALDFIHANIVQLVKEGRLDILPDRLHFTDDESINYFLNNANKYYSQVLDYVLENRKIIRIFLLESLSGGRYHGELFRFMDFKQKDADNSVFRTISVADRNFNYTDNLKLFKFFFSVIPLFTFAAYYDDLKKMNALNGEELCHAFLSSLQVLTASLVSGREMLLQNKQL